MKPQSVFKASKLFRFFLLPRREDESFLFFFRFAIGLFCLLHFIAYANDIETLYGTKALITNNLQKVFSPKGIPNLNTLIKFCEGIHLSANHVVSTFRILYIMLCIFVCIGLLTRLSALFLLILHCVLVVGSQLFSYGVDNFTSIALFYCFVFPTGRHTAIDKSIFKLRSGSQSCFRKILQIHLTIVYASSGIQKLIGSDWRNGEAIWQALNYYQFRPLFPSLNTVLISHPSMLIALGWAVALIELLYPFFMWKRKFRSMGLLLICLMHVGIAIFMGLYYFSTLMILLNLSAFLTLKYRVKPSLLTLPYN